jgi:aminoglycoside phosphotransferase (APT) family kinase protein
LIHGDLCGANIMVNETAQPLSVFDFGFLSTIGDPAFDASVSSAILNMYGPHAREIDDEVTEAMVKAFGYPPEVLMGYRAAYSLLTSNAYSPTGSDGHFRWCVSMLRREDVRSSLGL